MTILQLIFSSNTFALSVLLILFCQTANTLPSRKWAIKKKPCQVQSYWKIRDQIVAEEAHTAIGGSLVLEEHEIKANEVLLNLKYKEYDDAFQVPKNFLPGQNFIDARLRIESSKVFQFIKMMPKGSVLHVHDKAMTSHEFLFANITYQPNLYVCERNGSYLFYFFDTPNSDCNWQNLKELRNSVSKPSDLDTKIYQQLNMIVKDAKHEYSDIDTTWAKFQDIFNVIGPLVTYRPVFELYIYQGLLELYNDNVMYVEIRSSLSSLYELDGTTYSTEEVLCIYKDIVHRFIKEYPDFIGVKIIYSKNRKMSIDKLKENLEITKNLVEAHPDFVVGFDLVGQEDKGDPLVKYTKELRNAPADVHFFFHAGETNWYGKSTDENLIDAVLLKAKRIGHGYALLKHPKVMEYVKKRKIGIEVNPISNQVLNLVVDMRNHPASHLFAQDFPVVVSNDDPGFWGAQGLSYDFYEAYMGMMSRNADLRALKMLAMNSITYSSMNEEEQEKAFQVFNRRWKVFAKNVTRTFQINSSD